jgi:hypothetical protein
MIQVGTFEVLMRVHLAGIIFKTPGFSRLRSSPHTSCYVNWRALKAAEPVN